MNRKIDDLTIHNESIFALEKELKEHSKLQNEAHKAYAGANKEVNKLTLQLEIIVSEIVDEICREEKIPPSARSEIRRSRIASDKRYIKSRQRLNDAIENKEMLEGLSKAWETRGFRLSELTGLAERLLIPEPRVYSSNYKSYTNVDEGLEDEFKNLELS